MTATTFVDDAAQTIAWLCGRDEPNGDDRNEAEQLVARIQAKRVAAGLNFIPDVDDLISRE